MPAMQPDRNAIFDYAKGIGIILVVYGHVARGVHNAKLPIDHDFYAMADRIIYSFHMPLFFFVSGYFFLKSLEKRGAANLVAGKLYTVLYPYVVWSLIQGLFEAALSSYTNGSATLAQMLALLWQPQAQFWFLYVLFGVFLLAALVYRNSGMAWGNLVLGASVLYYFSGWSPADAYMLNALPSWFVFFACGVSASQILPRLDLGRVRWRGLAFVAFALAQWWDASGGAADDFALARLVLGLLGIGLVMLLSHQFAQWRWRWLEYMGKHSMEIYLIHVLAGSGTRIVLQKFLGATDPVLHLVAGTLAGLAMPLLVAVHADRKNFGWLFSAPLRMRMARA